MKLEDLEIEKFIGFSEDTEGEVNFSYQSNFSYDDIDFSATYTCMLCGRKTDKSVNVKGLNCIKYIKKKSGNPNFHGGRLCPSCARQYISKGWENLSDRKSTINEYNNDIKDTHSPFESDVLFAQEFDTAETVLSPELLKEVLDLHCFVKPSTDVKQVVPILDRHAKSCEVAIEHPDSAEEMDKAQLEKLKKINEVGKKVQSEVNNFYKEKNSSNETDEQKEARKEDKQKVKEEMATSQAEDELVADEQATIEEHEKDNAESQANKDALKPDIEGLDIDRLRKLNYEFKCAKSKYLEAREELIKELQSNGKNGGIE